MVKKICVDDILEDLDFFRLEILSGKIFVFYTDTILGLGGYAEDESCVQKLADLKGRYDGKPFLVMPSSLDWVFENCLVLDEFKELVCESFEGGGSSVVLKINEGVLPNRVLKDFGDFKTVGLRFSNDDFNLKVLRKLGVCFVSTSVNFAGESSITTIEGISEDILNQIDYLVLDEFESSGKPSSIFDLSGDEAVQLR